MFTTFHGLLRQVLYKLQILTSMIDRKMTEVKLEEGVEEIRLGHTRIFLKPGLSDVKAARDLLDFYA